ncbi:MAG: thiamine phosphate synthase [Phycisphaerales bacterium JB064]
MAALERMLDANVNRACEGLRTLEDLARFLLDDGELARRAKDARHAVRAAASSAGPRRLVAWRNTPGDVGTTISTIQEGSRANAGALAIAAGNRAAEALRACEEVAKVLGFDCLAFESARYEAYEIQRRLVSALGGGPKPRWSVCVLITADLCRQPWEQVALAACKGGAGCLQLREKGIDDRELLARASRLVEIARPHGVAVIVNDRPDIALLSGAAGVHVGQGDLSVADVRRLAGDRLLVGVSCSTLEMAQQAVRDGADYLGLGPMFASGTKPKDALSGPGLIEAVAADPVASSIGHLAISGIDATNLGELTARGCMGVAVCGAVCGAEDPEAATRELVELMGAARPAATIS